MPAGCRLRIRARRLGPHVQCPVCSLVWCGACGTQHDVQTSCDAFTLWRLENGDTDASFDSLVQERMQRCPRCRAPVEKSEGCNQMTCRCGNHFCYVCSAELPRQNPYDHFQGKDACRSSTARRRGRRRWMGKKRRSKRRERGGEEKKEGDCAAFC